MAQLQAWLTAFVFTELVEVPIYRRSLECPLLVAFGASAVTHPIVWFVFFHPAWQADYLTRVIAAELFAWLAEAAYFRVVVHARRALLWSAVANGASVGLGFLSRYLFGVP
jgi:hypothetical protein